MLFITYTEYPWRIPYLTNKDAEKEQRKASILTALDHLGLRSAEIISAFSIFARIYTLPKCIDTK